MTQTVTKHNMYLSLLFCFVNSTLSFEFLLNSNSTLEFELSFINLHQDEFELSLSFMNWDDELNSQTLVFNTIFFLNFTGKCVMPR